MPISYKIPNFMNEKKIFFIPKNKATVPKNTLQTI